MSAWLVLLTALNATAAPRGITHHGLRWTAQVQLEMPGGVSWVVEASNRDRRRSRRLPCVRLAIIERDDGGTSISAEPGSVGCMAGTPTLLMPGATWRKSIAARRAVEPGETLTLTVVADLGGPEGMVLGEAKISIGTDGKPRIVVTVPDR